MIQLLGFDMRKPIHRQLGMRAALLHETSHHRVLSVFVDGVVALGDKGKRIQIADSQELVLCCGASKRGHLSFNDAIHDDAK